MILEAIAITTLAAASMSDAERKRTRIKMMLGRWVELLEDLGLEKSAQVIATMLPGDPRDDFARAFCRAWQDQTSDAYSKHPQYENIDLQEAVELVDTVVARWNGKVIPIINLVEGRHHESSNVRGTVTDDAGTVNEYADLFHAKMAKLSYSHTVHHADDQLLEMIWNLEFEKPIPFDEHEDPNLYFANLYLMGPWIQFEARP
jgi:hypothetical protein